MDATEIIVLIDGQISRLQQARALLSSGSQDAAPKAKRGRPKGSVNKPAAKKSMSKPVKRNISPEGRKAIADAAKRRWAALRKEQAK